MASKKKVGALVGKAKPPTKSEIISQIADKTSLTKKDVGAVFDQLNGIIKKSLKSASEFSMPGLMKVRVVKKPATKARLGKNPFTGEEIMIKAKPARKTVKVTALKGLKDMV
jgi:nucleoid DNA-binding protein